MTSLLDVIWLSDCSQFRPTLPAVPLRRQVHRTALLAPQRPRGFLVVRGCGRLGEHRRRDGVGSPLRRRYGGAGRIAWDRGLELSATGAPRGRRRPRVVLGDGLDELELVYLGRFSGRLRRQERGGRGARLRCRGGRCSRGWPVADQRVKLLELLDVRLDRVPGF